MCGPQAFPFCVSASGVDASWEASSLFSPSFPLFGLLLCWAVPALPPDALPFLRGKRGEIFSALIRDGKLKSCRPPPAGSPTRAEFNRPLPAGALLSE